MWENFLISLNIMLNGMFGIFSVIVLLTLIVMLFQWTEKKFAKPEKSE